MVRRIIIKNRYEFAEGVTGVAVTPKWESQNEPPIWSLGGGVLGGWRDTKHPDEVLDLLTYVTTDSDVNSIAVTMSAYQPAV